MYYAIMTFATADHLKNLKKHFNNCEHIGLKFKRLLLGEKRTRGFFRLNQSRRDKEFMTAAVLEFTDIQNEQQLLTNVGQNEH